MTAMSDTDPLEVIRLAIQHATQNNMSAHDTRRLLSDALDRAEERVNAQTARDAEVAELRTGYDRVIQANTDYGHEVESLRTQLAENLKVVDAANELLGRAQRALAEAQATIEAIQRLVDEDAASYLSQGGLRAVGRILSAPSSTGGNWDCPKCGNDPEDCYCVDTEGGNDHE